MKKKECLLKLKRDEYNIKRMEFKMTPLDKKSADEVFRFKYFMEAVDSAGMRVIVINYFIFFLHFVRTIVSIFVFDSIH